MKNKMLVKIEQLKELIHTRTYQLENLRPYFAIRIQRQWKKELKQASTNLIYWQRQWNHWEKIDRPAIRKLLNEPIHRPPFQK